MSYRTAHILINNTPAGHLKETDEGYEFQYNSDYLNRRDAVAVSLTLPLKDTPYKSTIFFPFFDGLIPEGWLLNVVEETWKVDPKDRMGLLLVSCRDCIGNVSVRDPETEAPPEAGPDREEEPGDD